MERPIKTSLSVVEDAVRYWECVMEFIALVASGCKQFDLPCKLSTEGPWDWAKQFRSTLNSPTFLAQTFVGASGRYDCLGRFLSFLPAAIWNWTAKGKMTFTLDSARQMEVSRIALTVRNWNYVMHHQPSLVLDLQEPIHSRGEEYPIIMLNMLQIANQDGGLDDMLEVRLFCDVDYSALRRLDFNPLTNAIVSDDVVAFNQHRSKIYGLLDDLPEPGTVFYVPVEHAGDSIYDVERTQNRSEVLGGHPQDRVRQFYWYWESAAILISRFFEWSSNRQTKRTILHTSVTANNVTFGARLIELESDATRAQLTHRVSALPLWKR